MILDFCEIPSDGEVWEQFGQEFFLSFGLAIDSPPDRGADGGKDILMTERLVGPASAQNFRWLVSCKHTAHSGAAISETHEPNILERVQAFRADGFLGFYSTLPTAGLNTRLRALADARSIRGYKVFSGSLIESELLSLGRSWMLRRYLPESHKKIRPLHALFGDYVPLNCASCGKDLLESLYSEHETSLIAFARSLEDHGPTYKAVYCACKGHCDRIIESRLKEEGLYTAWTDISDIAMPNEFLRWVLAILTQIRAGQTTFSDGAFEKIVSIITAMGQKVLREVSEEERVRFAHLMSCQF